MEGISFKWSFFFLSVSVIMLTTLFWVPVGTTISYFDRKQRREEVMAYRWRKSRELIHPSDPRRVIHIRLVYFKPQYSLIANLISIYFHFLFHIVFPDQV